MLQKLLQTRIDTPSDINEHLQLLSELADGCHTIVEFGVRTGNSTVAFLAGLARRRLGGRLYSYDIAPKSISLPVPDGLLWTYTQTDTAKLTDMPKCDLLFIDTLHTYEQVKAELKHGNQTRTIAFHDTQLFGYTDEGTGAPMGIMPAIEEFMAENPEWQIVEKRMNNNGLLVIQR